MAVVATIAKGHDLDYMWASASVSAIGDYYIGAAEAGEPPGRWWGPAAQALGFALGQVVEREPYDLLFGQRKGPDGVPLSRQPNRAAALARYREIRDGLLAGELHAASERKAELRIQAARQARVSPLYLDLTVSFSKSVSVFHASLAENARLARLAGDRPGERHWAGLVTEMEEMIYAAVGAGMDYFQREAGYTRTGSHHQRADGRETGQWREAELAVALWLQHTSRDGDPQLHVHSQIAHIARTVVDGKWRAPDSLGYHEHVAAAGSIVAQHLEEAMTRRFGVSWVPREDGRGYEIAGISGELMRAFSSRRADIDATARELAAAFEERYGRAPSQRELGELRETANLATRKGKHDGVIDWDKLHKGWAARLAATVGVSLASVAPSVSRPGATTAARTDAGRGLAHVQLRQAAQIALALAQREKAAFTRADVIKHVGRVLPRTGLDPDAAARLVEQLADRALACEFADVACLEAPEPVTVPADLIRADGRSVYKRHGGTRYATQVQLSLEQRLLAQAQGGGAPCVTPRQAALLPGADAAPPGATRAIAADGDANRARIVHASEPGPDWLTKTCAPALDRAEPGARNETREWAAGLRPDQAAAARAALSSDHRVTVIDAPAGSGKTRVLAALADAWAAAGLGRVVGVTPSQASRNTLAAGVAEAYNTAQFLGHLPGQRGGRGRIPIGPGDLILADEASMISLPDIADLVGYVTERGAKLILAGDLQQLQPVENGGGLRLLAGRLGALELQTPVRFTQAWERAASLRLRAGDTTVLADYDARGRILGGPAEQMLEQAARRYVALTLAGTDVLLMACDHARRRELCRRIRGELQYLGLVAHGPGVTIADGQQASEGDLIVATRNDHRLQAGEPGRTLANGDLLRIDHITGDGLLVRRARDADPVTGRRRWSRSFLYGDYANSELGYAVTDHAAQSRTVHTGLQLINGTETRQQAYVGLTRGTHANIALVCTTATNAADPKPGPRPAPELARAGPVAADRVGQTRHDAVDSTDEALAVLAGVLARDGAELPALETQEQSFAAAENLAILHAQWQDETSAVRADHRHQLVASALPEGFRAELSHRSRWLWRTLCAAELAGLDPAEVMTTAIAERDLTGARDVAAVIDARIRKRIQGMVPLPQPSWSERIPALVRPGHKQYVTDLATAMDQRTQRIGGQAAEHQPAWALAALGPVPSHLAERFGWQRRASTIGAYREFAGYHHPDDPIGPEPADSDPDLRAAWHDAFACLRPPDGLDVRALPDSDLHLLRGGYQTATAWAPRYVTDALRLVRLGADDAELQAVRRDALATASAARGDHQAAAANKQLAVSHRAMATLYRSREMTLAAADSDRKQWEAVTGHDRQLALAADTELRRRHLDQQLPPLRSAEPEPVTDTELDELTSNPGAQLIDKSPWIGELSAQHETFATKHAAAKNAMAREFGRTGIDNIRWAAPLSSLAWPDAILTQPEPTNKPAVALIDRPTWQPDYEPEASE